MFRRRAVVRRGPGLVGTMARTAVIAGTATAVSKGVSGAMDSGAAKQQQQVQAQADSQAEMAAMQQQMAEMQAQQAQMAMQQQPVAAPAPVAAAPAAAGGTDLVSQLQQLAQLKTAGVLSEEEFQTAKTKLLAGG